MYTTISFFQILWQKKNIFDFFFENIKPLDLGEHGEQGEWKAEGGEEDYR